MNKIHILFILFIIISCSAKKTIPFKEKITNFTIDSDIYTQNISINKKENEIIIVYSDEKTLSLKSAIIHLPEISVEYIDKIDLDPILNPLFGIHSLINNNNDLFLSYCDYENDKKIHFKLITKKKINDQWKVFPQQINSFDFTTIQANDYIYLIYYDKKLQISILGNNIFKNLKYDFSEIVNIYNLKAIFNSIENKIYLFYLNQQNSLYFLEIKFSDGNIDKVSQPVFIDNNISFYKAYQNKDDFYILYYNNKNNLLKLYNKKNKNNIGYFLNLYSSDMFFIEDKIFFLFSSIIKNEKKENKFGLSIAYKMQNNKWIEESLVTNDTPIQAINSYNDVNNVYIIYGGNSIKILSIEKKYFE